MTVNYKLRKANDFKYQIKDGRNVVENIIKASGQWAVCCKLFPTIEMAVSYFSVSREEFLNAMSENEYKVVVKWLDQK